MNSLIKASGVHRVVELQALVWDSKNSSIFSENRVFPRVHLCDPGAGLYGLGF